MSHLIPTLAISTYHAQKKSLKSIKNPINSTERGCVLILNTYIIVRRSIVIKRFVIKLWFSTSQCLCVYILLKIQRSQSALLHRAVHHINFQSCGSEALLLGFICNYASVVLERIGNVGVVAAFASRYRLQEVSVVNSTCTRLHITFEGVGVAEGSLHVFTGRLYVSSLEHIALFADCPSFITWGILGNDWAPIRNSQSAECTFVRGESRLEAA